MWRERFAHFHELHSSPPTVPSPLQGIFCHGGTVAKQDSWCRVCAESGLYQRNRALQPLLPKSWNLGDGISLGHLSTNVLVVIYGDLVVLEEFTERL